jgi:putative lipoprotein
MKKILKLITPVLAILVLLTACGGEKTKVYTLKDSDTQTTETTIYYSGDTVNKLSSISTFDIKGSDSELAYNSIKESVESQLKDTVGVTYKVEKKDNSIIVEFNIDYEKVDFDKDKAKLNFQTSSINEERKLSNIEKKMKDLGAKEKK